MNELKRMTVKTAEGSFHGDEHIFGCVLYISQLGKCLCVMSVSLTLPFHGFKIPSFSAFDKSRYVLIFTVAYSVEQGHRNNNNLTHQ